MEEIEVKILDIDKNKVIKRLEELGARKTFEGDVHASYFDFPDKRLDKNDSFLRLRKKGDIVELTFKKLISREKAKIMQEDEVVVNDFENMIKILKDLGLVELRNEAKKHRVSYELEKVHFEIDSPDDIPAYLEIEAPDLEKLENAVEKVGFSMKDAKPWSGKHVREYYQKKYNL